MIEVFNECRHTNIKGELVRHEHSVPWRRALWGDYSRRHGTPRDVAKGVAREPSLIFAI